MGERHTGLGFSLPLTLIFVFLIIIFIIIFGWIVLPIAVGIFLLITTIFFVCDWLKRSKTKNYRLREESSELEKASDILNLILYRAIFSRTEEQARKVAVDIKKRESSEFIDRAIAEIKKELATSSLSLTEMHPYAGNPTEKEIKEFLTTLLHELERSKP